MQLESWIGYELLTQSGETVAILLIYLLLRLSISRSVQSLVKQVDRRFHLLKYSFIILNALLVLGLIQVWFDRSWSVASFVGLLSAGLSIVFREPLLNLAGWVFILTRRPFSVGERIQVGDGHAGDVVDIGLNDFTIMEIGNWIDSDQSTGRILHVPNGLVFTHSIANYNQGFPFLWNELQVLVTFESDWQRGIDILQSVGDRCCNVDAEMQKKTLEDLQRVDSYFIAFKHLTPIVYLAKGDSGIILTLRYLCEPRRRRSTENEIWKAIFTEFAKSPNLEFAYATQRFVKDGDPTSRTNRTGSS